MCYFPFHILQWHFDGIPKSHFEQGLCQEILKRSHNLDHAYYVSICIDVNKNFVTETLIHCLDNYGHFSGPGCSKLTTSLVNVSLKFQTLIFNICQYFLLKKCEKLFAVQKLLSFFQ